MPRRSKARPADALSVDDWRAAAVHALAHGGLAAVAIEPLARKLGVTKGSGYWHFENRQALLRAALEEWEARATEQVIAGLLRVADPRERLTLLFREGFRTTLDSRVYAALAASDQDPVVSPVLQRVATRRLEFLDQCYRELGHSPTEARHRAVTAYAAYLGVVMLRRHATELLPADDRDALIDHLIGAIV